MSDRNGFNSQELNQTSDQRLEDLALSGQGWKKYPELLELQQTEKVIHPIISHGMAVAIAISVVLSGTNTLLSMRRDAMLAQFLQKAPPTLVQTRDGGSLKVEPIESNDRIPLSIKKFVKDSFWGLFNMPGKLIDEKGKIVDDPGKTVGGNKKVTTIASYTADGVLSPQYQLYFLAELAKITPQEIFEQNSDVIATLKFDSVGLPEPISPGHWRVRVVSYLKEKRSQNLTKVTPINRIVYVRAVTTSDDNPFPSEPIEETIAAITASRLEIYKIEPILN